MTARNLYGAPSEWAASKTISEQEKKDQVEYNENPWLMWLDSSLFMLAIIAGINGLMNLFGPRCTVWAINLICHRFRCWCRDVLDVPFRLQRTN